MSSATITYPLLVSELPPASLTPGHTRWAALRARRAARRDAARFERSLRGASPSERTDLLHAARRG